MIEMQTERGTPLPLGAIPCADGVNVSTFSESATEMMLLVFEDADAVEPIATFRFDPFIHKTFHFWHMLLRGLKPGMFYAFRVDGPNDPANGLRYNPNKVLLGPYSRAISKKLWSRADACTPEDNVATSMRSGVIDLAAYDWEGDKPLGHSMHDTIIYEVHVGGLTRSPSSQVKNAGTYAGVIEKIPYLKDLGITAVELLPVFEFDDSNFALSPTGANTHNYWGYGPAAFFAPHSGYCVDPYGLQHANEFRDMVKALHKAGIEVILDVVFNHTDEGNELGPTFSFRGFDNATYYILNPENRAQYENYSGVGNTFNCNHPIPQKLIIDCLRYWVTEMHVDGFRFDEGSVLSRGEDGTPLEHPPVVWSVELDDALSSTKVIAEAWDAAGLYQVGHFPGDRWSEWNGKFRDDVRRFVKSDPGLTGAIASRIGGSSDVYQARWQTPENSINFITCHDGFTLNDVVSYNQKHNEANGEGNRDGINENFSWNCGVEGSTEDPSIEALRARQVRNFFTILMLSRGVPMMLGGDEFRRTQGGNNNAYNQDNATSWFDWTLAEKNKDMVDFFRRMIAFRKAHAELRRPHFYSGAVTPRGLNDITWHGTKLDSPGFNDSQSRTLAFTIGGFGENPDLHVMMNMFWEPLDFEVPVIAGRSWQKVVDTFDPKSEAVGPEAAKCTVRERSIVVLENA